MANYKYLAKTLAGQRVEGVFEALDYKAAIELLRERNYFPISVTEVQDTKKTRDIKKKISSKAISLMCSQMGSILKAGMPLLRALDLLMSQTEDKELRGIVRLVYLDVQRGRAVSESFRINGPKLPELFIHMLESGEASGRLDETFERLGVHYEKEYKMRSKITSILVYPIILIVFALAILFGMMFTIVPMFLKLFKDNGAKLPAITKILVSVQGFLSANIVWMLPMLVAFGLLFKFFISREPGLSWYNNLKLNLKPFGPVNRKIIAQRFSESMSVLIAGGLPMTSALSITAKVLGNLVAMRAVNKVNVAVQEGRGLHKPLAETKLFPKLLTEMVSMGEESGTLETLLGKVSEYYESEVEESLKRIANSIEPMIIIFVGVVILFIMLAIYVPMFNMSAAFG